MITKEDVIDVLEEIADPELQIDIVTLELVRSVDIKESGKRVGILITFTTPQCPAREEITEAIMEEVGKLDGVKRVDVVPTFDPPWKPSADLRDALGI